MESSERLQKGYCNYGEIISSSRKNKLTDQIVRSSRSVAANIAEGYGRYHYQESIRSCRIARGSLTETLEHLICACDEKYIDEKMLNEMKSKYARCLKLLNGYILYLKNRKKSGE